MSINHRDLGRDGNSLLHDLMRFARRTCLVAMRPHGAHETHGGSDESGFGAVMAGGAVDRLALHRACFQALKGLALSAECRPVMVKCAFLTEVCV